MGSRTAWTHLVVVGLVAAAGCTDGVADFDGDGTVDEADCAPDDPAIHPGADDAAVDGIDQDCDGIDGPAGDDDTTADDDDLSDDDAGDDDAGDDDTTPGSLSRICAGAHHATGGGFTIDACTGPLEIAAGVATDGHWRVTVDALRWTEGGSR